jgi:hypothetical protein
MSEARSPRESCSTTIGTSGLTPAPCGRGVTPSQCGSARRPRRWSALWSGNGPSRSVYVGRCVPHAGRAARAAAPRFPPNGDRRQGESCLRASARLVCGAAARAPGGRIGPGPGGNNTSLLATRGSACSRSKLAQNQRLLFPRVGRTSHRQMSHENVPHRRRTIRPVMVPPFCDTAHTRTAERADELGKPTRDASRTVHCG